MGDGDLKVSGDGCLNNKVVKNDGCPLVQISDAKLPMVKEDMKIRGYEIADFSKMELAVLSSAGGFNFEFDNGKSVYCGTKNLGMVFDNRLPIVMKKPDPGSWAESSGIQAGFVLKKVAGKDIS